MRTPTPIPTQASVTADPKAQRLFDLNIEEVLENWQVSHALREIISNALDEQVLSGTADIAIAKDERGHWTIRDQGRGLRIEHFTLNENKEKLGRTSGVIGKFGVGLKDALATFHRREIGVVIKSPFGTFSLTQTEKHGFADITTLHVRYDEMPNDMEGTEFVFDGVTDEQMGEAKALFLKFNDDVVLESTRYGEVLSKSGPEGRVYISGVFAAEEPNFLFSYNVTDLTETMRKRLNRERLNVGRTTYSDRIRQILKESRSDDVMDALAEAISERSHGTVPDELQWIDVVQLALTHLHEKGDVLFVTEQELHGHPDVMDHARRDGLEIVLITGAEKKKLEEQARSGGVVTRTFERYVDEFNQSFEYTFVDENDLDDNERAVFALTSALFDLVGARAGRRPEVRLSETMRMTVDDTEGVWDTDLQAIVIKRSQLSSPLRYAGTLLHEVAHALSGTRDATREFESVLTKYLGRTSVSALESASPQA